jgi:pyruvate formate lyase activating enzyme
MPFPKDRLVKKQGVLCDSLSGGRAVCLVCQRRCVLGDREKGWCGTRVNISGTVCSLTYAEVASLAVNPIEKQSIFHFAPGSSWLTLGSLGCNFRCSTCRNPEHSHWTKGPMRTRLLTPEELVDKALDLGCSGISWSLNEPALWFEYTLETARIARQRGLRTNYVTNGYLSEDALTLLAPVLDVYCVDVKGFSGRTYERIAQVREFQGILKVAGAARACGIHVEVVTTLIPGFNDDLGELRELAAWIEEDLGPQTPWHVSGFFPPGDQAETEPTSLDLLESVHELGLDQGLWYVYLGLPGSQWENTYCHFCGELLVERYNIDLFDNRISAARCPECNARVPGHYAED